MSFRRIFYVILVLSLLAGGVYFLGREQVRQHLPGTVQDCLIGIETFFWNELPEHVEQPLDSQPLPAEPSEKSSESTESQTAGQEETSDEASADEGPVLYEKNPRYRVEQSPEWGEILRSEVLKGDTAGKILGEWMDANMLAEALAAAKPIYPLTQICLGQPFAIVRNQEGGFRAFKYEINKEKALLLELVGGKLAARTAVIDYAITLAHVKGTITSNLSNAVADNGEGVGLAIALANVFASEINFITDLREGDSFEVLVEKRFRHNEFKGYGRLIGARFTNQNKLHTAYLFRNDRGRETHYNRKGENLHRELLKAPLSFLRVTSRYSMARKHPVYGNVRPHQGIDYGAPHGTPIMAVGDGVITRIGWAGGYGKQITIRHANGLESMYGHMSRFASNMSKGKRVRQGQTIGYVGATGTATGPHLDFRIKQGGKFVNPGKLVVPRDRGIEKKRRAQFNTVVKAVDAYWDGQKSLADYDPDTWLKD